LLMEERRFAIQMRPTLEKRYLRSSQTSKALS